MPLWETAFDPGGSKVGTLVAAAMETAGINIQADMLALVNGPKGQLLAGYFYLTAIIGAVITVAIGGSYKWARYLMVGPPLFFFLTQVNNPSNGAAWQFADASFDRGAVVKALQGVRGETQASTKVASFFHVWNVFMSSLSQELIELLNLTADGSHLDFMTKVERYMNFWLTSKIANTNLRAFIGFTLIAQCSDYFMMKKNIADPHLNDFDDMQLRLAIDKRGDVPVFQAKPYKKEENEMMWWLTTQADPKLEPQKIYTCDEVWEMAVLNLRHEVQDKIMSDLNLMLAENQEHAKVLEKFLRKIGTQTNRTSERVTLLDEGKLLQAVDWIIARSLWQETWDRNKDTEYIEKENHGGFFAFTKPNGAWGYRASGAATHNSMQQFNRTEVYQYKGDYVNGSLAMPHFQGMALMFLAASYPFFAMAVVLPGRAGAMLLWMSLWAWVKLWDVGFAVVMMIDNILYALLPRGPNLPPEAIKDAGLAWSRILEVDPTYAAETYYNLIATCLYAVPLVTGVFVKGGGRELVNIFHGSWTRYSSQLSISGLSYERTMQAQRYMREQAEGAAETQSRAWTEAMMSDKARQHFQNYLTLKAGGDAASSLAQKLLGSKVSGEMAKAYTDALADQEKNRMTAYVDSYVAQAMYNYSMGPEAQWASTRSVAARWATHDTAYEHPGKAMMAQQIADDYVNVEKMAGTMADKGMQTAASYFNWLLGGKAPSD